MSRPTGGIPASEVNLVHKHAITVAVMAGLHGKLFWFLFFKLQTPSKSPELAKFSQSEEADLVAASKDVRVTKTVTFGDIYQNRIKSTTTPLPHHVFKDWYYNRVLILGDSAHKVSL